MEVRRRLPAGKVLFIFDTAIGTNGKKNPCPNPEHTFLSLVGMWWNLLVFKYFFCVGVFQGLQGLPGDKGVRVSYQQSTLCLIANTCTQWQPSKLLSTCCSQHVFVCQTFIQVTLHTCVLEGDTHSSFHHLEHCATSLWRLSERFLLCSLWSHVCSNWNIELELGQHGVL